MKTNPCDLKIGPMLKKQISLSIKKWRVKEHLSTYWKIGCRGDSQIFSVMHQDNVRVNKCKMEWGKFQLDVKKSMCTLSVYERGQHFHAQVQPKSISTPSWATYCLSPLWAGRDCILQPLPAWIICHTLLLMAIEAKSGCLAWKTLTFLGGLVLTKTLKSLVYMQMEEL